MGFKLYVKDHPAASIKDPRRASFYKDILKLQNVILLDSKLDKDMILKKCQMVITISGTTGLEAAFFNKPVITFTDTIYSNLSYVFVLKNLEDLPSAIKNSLSKKVDENELIKFVNYVDNNSHEINMRSIGSSFELRFRYHKLSEEDVKMAIFENKEELSKLALWYIKKFNKIKGKP
jgi:lipid A disaccharide synthetase